MSQRPIQADPDFSPEQSLRLIDTMINRVKDQYAEDGHLYLFWGWLVFGLSIAQFVLLRAGFAQHYLVWSLTWVAVIYQIVYLRKKRRVRRVRTYQDSIVASLWITFVVLMVLTAVLDGMDRQHAERGLNPVMIAVYGMPVFLTGIVVRFRPLIFGGISCWVLCLFVPVTPPEYRILFIAAAMLTAWIYPGIALRNRYKKQYAEGRQNA